MLDREANTREITGTQAQRTPGDGKRRVLSVCVVAIGITRSVKAWRKTLKLSRGSRSGMNVPEKLEKSRRSCSQSALGYDTRNPFNSIYLLIFPVAMANQSVNSSDIIFSFYWGSPVNQYQLINLPTQRVTPPPHHMSTLARFHARSAGELCATPYI